MVQLTRTEWHDTILSAPDQKGWQSSYALQQVRHTGIKHVRLPCNPGGLGPGILPGLELLRRMCTTIQIGKFWSGFLIIDRAVEIGACGDREKVCDFALRRFYAGGA